MTGVAPERWARVSAILGEVLGLGAERRGERLAALCGGDAALRAEVEWLLALEGRHGIIDSSHEELLESLLEEEDVADKSAPVRVGPWRIVRELGRGGMGVVYLAERAEGDFEQRVALKVVKRGLDTDEVLARFRRERQILARLEHPAIARLVDGGATEDGRPYLAMEHVEGEPIVGYCDHRRLAVEERLALFRRACDAVQYAHRNVVVHCDLKPSNILINAEGEPKLLDFGIAKLLAAEGRAEPTAWTRLGVRAMTPEYAAPEQVRGEPPNTATDVYALGVVLYELLSGRRPYRLPQGLGGEAQRIILEVEPQRPSAAVDAVEQGAPAPVEVATARRSTPGALRRRLAGDLDAIVSTALRKEPERRYATVQSLIDDLERHLAGEPVAARAEGAWYRTGKFVRRHRAGVALAAAALVAAIAFAGAMAAQARRIARERDRAERVSAFLAELFKMAEPAVAGRRDVTAREVLDRGVERIERDLAEEPGLQGQLLHTMGEAYRGLGLFGKAELILGRAVELREQALEPDDPSTLLSKNRLANLYARTGRYDDALRLFEETLAAQRRVLGAEHAQTLQSMNDLAFWYGEKGRLREAELLHEETLEIRRRVLGAEHADTLWTLNDLAILYGREGRYAEAEELLRGVLASWQRAGHTGRSFVFRGNLAGMLLAQGRTAEAEGLLREVLGETERLLGREHSHTLAAMKDLAQVYREQGRYEEAEALLEDAVATLGRVQGAENPQTLLATSALSRVYARLGRGEEGEMLLRATLESQRRTLGATHPNAVASEIDLACLFALRGERAQALDWIRQAVAGGWRNDEALRREPDLAALRADPEFQRLLAAAAAP